MSRFRVPATLVAACSLALLLPSLSHAAWPHGSGTNVPICTAAGDQDAPEAVTDGAGGAIFTWMDIRSGNFDVYAQHVLASGVVDPAWPANGRVLCNATDSQGYPRLVSDGAGGAIVAWHDARTAGIYDIYAQHVLASGAVDGAWPANGRLLCGAANHQMFPALVSDGAGGAIVTWSDARTDAGDIYAQRVLSTGVVDPAWPIDGRLICNAAALQEQGLIISDGSGGAIVTWVDLRSGDYDIYAQRVQASGVVDPAWPANGRAMVVNASTQHGCHLASDGAGGAIIAWHDNRNGTYDIYAQHVLSTGFTDPAWAANGSAICTPGGTQLVPEVITDGAGGAFVTWYDDRTGGVYDIFAHHVLASGAVDGAWPVDGRALCTAPAQQQSPKIVTDGAGGAIVTWMDFRGPNSWDIYAQRVSASGVVDLAWPADGRAVCTANDVQSIPTIVADGAGGAIIVWQDYRTGTNLDIYTQRVAPSGYLGNPDPVLVDVRDVPLDQGGKVKLTWNASYLDTEQPYFVDHYWIFRSAPPAVAAAAVAAGARLLRPGDAEPLAAERAFLAPIGTTAASWEFVASAAAAHFTSNYSYVASTTSDSIAASNPRTAFMIVAYNASNTVFFASNPDSGYSVDNLPPAIPAPFTGNYQGGATHLHWNPNLEPDLAFYRLYRGASAGFVPSPGNRIASPPDTGYADPGPNGSYYKLSAVDSHGNESGYALVHLSATTAVGDGIPVELAFGRPSPNPAVTLATVHLALPREAQVSLTVNDIAGREVRRLISGRVAAGERDVSWDLRDASGGRVADGIYFLTLGVDSRTITRRIAVVN